MAEDTIKQFAKKKARQTCHTVRKTEQAQLLCYLSLPLSLSLSLSLCDDLFESSKLIIQGRLLNFTWAGSRRILHVLREERFPRLEERYVCIDRKEHFSSSSLLLFFSSSSLRITVVANTLLSSTGDSVPSACAECRKGYLEECPGSWVLHFDQTYSHNKAVTRFLDQSSKTNNK